MADQKFNISFVIGAVDNVTLKVMGIKEKIDKTFAPLDKVGQSFSLLGSELGVGKLGHALTEVGHKGHEAFKELLITGAELYVLTKEIGEAFEFVVKGAAESAAHIEEVSQRIGISTTTFQGLQYAATQSGFAMDKLEPVLTKLSQHVGEASEGTGDMAGIFRALGVSIKDAHGNMRTMEQILPDVFNGLSKIENESTRNAVSIKLFGREGVKFASIAKEGAGGLQTFTDRAKELGLVMSEDMISNGEKMSSKFEEVGLVFSRLRDVIGAELFPVMTQFINEIEKAVVEAKPEIIAFAKAFAADLPDILRTIVEIFHTLVAVVTPVIAIFKVLSSIFGAAHLIFGALALMITGKLIFAIYGLMGALVKLGIIAASTPIGWIAIGIGAVIIAIIALIRYWEPIKAFFVGLIDNWSGVLRIVLLMMGPLGWLAAMGITIYKNWDKIAELFGYIGDKISKVGNFFGLGSATPTSTAATRPQVDAAGVINNIAQTANPNQSTENHLVVDFNNAPQGTRIKTEKAESSMDLNMGYGMASA